MKPACREGTVLLNLSSLNHTLLTRGFICLVGSDSWILPELFLVDRPGILNRMKHIPTRNGLFINANYMRRREKKRVRERRPRRCGVPLPVSVICYLHLYTFFSFNKRRPGFSVTFMDSLFQKKNDAITIIVCKIAAPRSPLLRARARGARHAPWAHRPRSTRELPRGRRTAAPATGTHAPRRPSPLSTMSSPQLNAQPSAGTFGSETPHPLPYWAPLAPCLRLEGVTTMFSFSFL